MKRCECPVDDSLGCLTNHAANAARHYLMQELSKNGINMTVEQFKVMVVLWKEKVSTQQDIADFIGKDKTSITRLIDGLEKRALVQRTYHEKDKRCKLITLTTKGLELETSTMEVLNLANQTLHSQFEPQELEITLKVLKKMCSFLY